MNILIVNAKPVSSTFLYDPVCDSILQSITNRIANAQGLILSATAAGRSISKNSISNIFYSLSVLGVNSSIDSSA